MKKDGCYRKENSYGIRLFLPVWNGESLAGIVMPFCPQSNEPVNITGFHILKVPAFKVSLYGGNLKMEYSL